MTVLRSLVGVVLLVGVGTALAAPPVGPMFEIPRSLQAEHAELHETLKRAQQEGGELAVAARNLAGELAPHFEKEEEFALPQLGLLRQLVRGDAEPEMRPAIEMAERLKADYEQMLEEHGAIRQAAQRLRTAAQKAAKPEYVAFADALANHARTEEEVLYPSAILIGEYLKLRLN